MSSRWHDFIQRLKQKYGEAKYEWLVACHTWHVIARRLSKGMSGCGIPAWKREISQRYYVGWAADCWLCDQFNFCPACPLRSCVMPGSAYDSALSHNDANAARYIEEVIYALRDKM